MKLHNYELYKRAQTINKADDFFMWDRFKNPTKEWPYTESSSSSESSSSTSSLSQSSFEYSDEEEVNLRMSVKKDELEAKRVEKDVATMKRRERKKKRDERRKLKKQKLLELK